MHPAEMARVARHLAFAVAAISAIAAAQGCTGGDAKNCSNVRASNYDRSCKFDSDCVAFIGPNDCCAVASISAAAQAQYMSDFAGCAREDCAAECTNQGPCCFSGACEYATADECHPTAPAEDAAGDTGADARSDGGAADAMPDACAPSGCVGACLSLSTHNVSTMVDGCLVWQCCVADAADAAMDAAADASAE